MPIDSPAAFAGAFDVSRETLERLTIHARLLERWNPRINLVAASTLPTLWHRHMADSAQLWPLRPHDLTIWADIGAGAGFPGLVVAALAAEQAPDCRVRLIESDARKSAFLAEVIREAALPATVSTDRWQILPAQRADVVSARALATLTELLGAVEKHACPNGIGLFPKGETVHKEIDEANRRWRFDWRLVPSRTEPKAAILEIGAVHRV